MVTLRTQIPVTGVGRILTLHQPIRFLELVPRIKANLSLSHVRLARPVNWTEDHVVQSVAACAGSGAQVLRGVQADVYLTGIYKDPTIAPLLEQCCVLCAGEMGHHDVLDATSRGVAVVLCEHSNTERGFLHLYRSLLQTRTGQDLNIVLASSDCDPLVVK